MIAEPAPTFAVQLASAADPAELEAWLAAAKVGERAQYASGVDLPIHLAGVVLVSRWVQEGCARTFRKRDRNDPRRWHFLVERIEKACGRATSCARMSGSPREATHLARRANTPDPANHARAQMNALMDLLRSCAARGHPCPGLGETAKLLGLPRGTRGKRRARYLFDRLAAERRISIDWPGTGQARVVTVLKGRGAGTSTGKGGPTASGGENV